MGGSRYDDAAARNKDIFKMRSWANDKRNFKGGAAGELFVLKFLERILPNFGLENWTSSIRHHVSVLEELTSIGECEGKEITGIQYKYCFGKSTKLLTERKYLRPGSVTEEPDYLIEVKTTVGECKSPFYVSDEQYSLMEKNAIDKSTKASHIYMLWRVSDVDQDKIGLRVFVDPWAARDGSLHFELSNWKVQVSVF